MYQKLSFQSVVQITNHHILKVMLTFLSQEALPKTTRARLFLARTQNQGLSSETENIYTAGPKSPCFLTSVSEPEALGGLLAILKDPVFLQRTSRPRLGNRIHEDEWVVFPLKSKKKYIQKSLLGIMRTNLIFTPAYQYMCQTYYICIYRYGNLIILQYVCNG